MAIAVGVHASKATASGTTAVTTGVTTTSGSTIVLFAHWGSEVFSSIADSKGNTWTIIGAELNASSHKSRAYYCANVTGGASHTFTLTLSTSGAPTIYMCEFTGAATTSPIDQSGSGNDTSSPYTTTGLTTTQANEALITFAGGNSGSNPATHAESGLGSSTIQENITNGSSFWTGAIATKIVSATGTYTPSWTESGASSMHVYLVTVKEAAAAGLIVNPFSGRGGAAGQPVVVA